MATTTKTKRRTPRKSPAKSITKKRGAIAKKAQPVTLVTGGTGFLGAHLVRQLIEAGTKNVRVMATSIPSWLDELGIQTIQGSITNAEDVARAVEGVTEIYHLAGRVSRESTDTREMYSIHVDGTRLLCDAAQAVGDVKTIVMASTSGTIAVTDKGDVIPDEEWPTPLDIISRWPYYASKYYQEQTALERFAGRGRRLVIMNPSLLLGPGDERLSSTKIVLDFMAQKIKAVPGGGLSFVDVRDTAAAFRAAMREGRHGERYLLGSANWTFKTFFGRLERLTKTAAPMISLPSKFAVAGSRFVDHLWRQWNLAPPVEPAAIEMAEHFWYLNSSKAATELGFTPRDPAETLLDTVAYVRENFFGSSAFDRERA